MQLNHTVPFYEVELAGFVRVELSPMSYFYLSTDDFDLVRQPDELAVGLKLVFPTKYAAYGVSYRGRSNWPLPNAHTFRSGAEIPELLHWLSKDIRDGTSKYFFGYQLKSGAEILIPENCPPPPAPSPGLSPKLIAVLVRT